MGSKARHADEIIPIASANRKKGQTWVEPFVGGGNVICRVPPDAGPRIGSDANWRMIVLLDAVGNRGWDPPERVSEEEYNKIKKNQDDYPPELVAFVATACSFGSNWFACYARNGKYDEDEKTSRQYARLGRQAALRDAPGLRGIKFLSFRYEDLTPHMPPESVIYCDPPYTGTVGYAGSKTDIDVGQSLSLNAWNQVAFWRWADARVEEGHQVFVSEYSGPPAAMYRSKPDPVLAARLRSLQADPKSSKTDIDAAVCAIKESEQQHKLVREHRAARWQVMWEKEVASTLDSKRGGDGKLEVEKLFHRKP